MRVDLLPLRHNKCSSIRIWSPRPHAGCILPPPNRSHYHASLSAEAREEVQAAWSRDEVQVIVATIAFGEFDGVCRDSR